MEYLLELKGITKKFPGVVALDQVDFSLQKGEIRGLVGENGAGKSTLIKIITGALQPDAGSLMWLSQPVSFDYPWKARHNGIAFIHQNRSLIPFFTGFENIYLGRPYPRNKFGLIQWKKMKEEVQEIMAHYQLQVNIDKPVQELQAGEQTLVEIIRVLLDKTSLMVFDEPTAALTDAETQLLFKVIRTLKTQGVTFLYVSHRLDEVFDIADTITVLRNGKVIKTGAVKETKKSDIVNLMAGEKVLKTISSPSPTKFPETILSVNSLSLPKSLLKNVSFELKRGEIFGVFGLVGAGQNELIETLFGVHVPYGGTISVEGKEIHLKNPQSAMQCGILLIPGDRLSQGLILSFVVRENISLPILERFRIIPYCPIPHRKKEINHVYQMIRDFNIQTSGTEQIVSTLSGGNQQKVVLSKWIGYGAKILLCNEPTLGVDVVSRREIYHFLYNLSQKGTAIIVCSTDLEEITTISHKIGVMNQGKLVDILPNINITKSDILNRCYLGNGAGVR